MTADFDLTVGSDLVINCSIKITSLPAVNKRISSSDLVIERGKQILSNFTRVIDDRTVQLKIPNATEKHGGLYICRLSLPDKIETVVCATKVNVGCKCNSSEN